jgi:hypothetical protein
MENPSFLIRVIREIRGSYSSLAACRAASNAELTLPVRLAMLWPMAVPILQTLVALILVLLGVDTANNPPTTITARRSYLAIFIFLGLLLLSLSWIQYRNVQRKEAAFHAQAPVFQVQPAIVPPAPEKESPAIDSNQLALQQKYQSVLGELATNPSLAPNVREHIIIATAKLGRDAQALKQAPSDEVLSAAQSARDKLLPYFDYAIKSLAALSEKEAGLKGDKSDLIYQGLPQELSPEAQAGKRSRKNAAEIKFEKNAGWNFQIEFAEVVTPQYQANLSVTCKGGVLVLRNAGDAIETRIEDLSGESSAHEPASGDEAKTNIENALEKLAASESDALQARQ